MAWFLDQINGGFVVHTKTDADILSLVASRIYPDVAPQDTHLAHIIYTQAEGHRLKSHDGMDPNRTLALHVYAIAEDQPTTNRLAELLEDLWLAADHVDAAGTTVLVCNGGIVDSGQWYPKDSSDVHLFYKRLVLRMLLSA